MNCTRCHVPNTRMLAADAERFFFKLRPFLRVVRSWGCYTPARDPRNRSAGDHSLWPRHAWDGPGTFPLTLKWEPRGEASERPTFTQFIRAYGIDVEVD